MISVSLCMIFKNEEDVIERCLESTQNMFDEIIIVDTGSNDNTKKIAEKFTNNIYNFEWCDDFSKARNYAFSKATKDYIMWLDADDVISDDNVKLFLKLKEELSNDIDMVMMKYSISFDSENNPTYSYYRERLLKKEKNYQWVGNIHEVITPNGNVKYSDINIYHKKVHTGDPNRNLKIFEKMIHDSIILSPREQFYYSREFYYNKRYDEAIKGFEEFLNSGLGWYENCISACIDLHYCYLSINKPEKALNSLFNSFMYDKPRAEVCCLIGNYFFNISSFNIAIYWYELATTLTPDTTTGGFYNLDSYDFIPYLQLCVCYDKLKEYEKAYEYNEKAGKIKPTDVAYLYNKNYFNTKKAEISAPNI